MDYLSNPPIPKPLPSTQGSHVEDPALTSYHNHFTLDSDDLLFLNLLVPEETPACCDLDKPATPCKTFRIPTTGENQ
jgi:hypothetical protein